jgi:ParB-like nuclease domain
MRRGNSSMTLHREPWTSDEVRNLNLELLDERLQRYRLAQPKLEQSMARSLQRYGQVSPIVVCVHDEAYVIIDGFKRLHAARSLKGVTYLSARRMDVDEQGAKAALYNLNSITSRPLELEESWIVHALVREDGMAQVELRLGLLTPAIARQLTRLPMGNQAATLTTTREASLTSTELSGVVDLLLASSTTEQTTFVLKDPRRALRQADERYVHAWDPRMSAAGNRIAKRLAFLLDSLAKMHSWLRYQGRGDLQSCDRQPLEQGFVKLASEASQVAEASEDFVNELRLP